MMSWQLLLKDGLCNVILLTIRVETLVGIVFFFIAKFILENFVFNVMYCIVFFFPSDRFMVGQNLGSWLIPIGDPRSVSTEDIVKMVVGWYDEVDRQDGNNIVTA